MHITVNCLVGNSPENVWQTGFPPHTECIKRGGVGTSCCWGRGRKIDRKSAHQICHLPSVAFLPARNLGYFLTPPTGPGLAHALREAHNTVNHERETKK